MASYDEVASRWVGIALGTTDRQQLRNERMPVDGDSIYSYGSHFEIARLLRDRKGKPSHFLINGDTWGPTTSRHQSTVRGVIGQTGLPSVIIPHRALNAAGIDRDSVRIVDVTADRHETIEHITYEQPPRSVWDTEPIYETVPMTAKDIDAALDAVHQRDLDQHRRFVGYGWAEYVDKPEPTRPTVDKVMHQYVNGIGYFNGTKRVVVGQRRFLRSAPRSWRTIDVTELPDGRTEYRWETTRHWLGESLVEAEVEYTVRRKCQHCQGLPMVTVGPGTRPTWIAPNDGTTDDNWRRGGVYAEPAVCRPCWGRGTVTVTRRRRAKYLSGFDANETRPSYFFCELPPGCKATTVALAYEALKPDSVKLAEQMGRDVKRQGDIYAIPLANTDRRALRTAGATFTKRGGLLATNHVATEVAYLPDGTTVVRGTLTHAPNGRAPDHKRVPLGNTWHVVQKNTVPVAA